MYLLPYGSSSFQVPDRWHGQAGVLSPGPFPEVDPVTVVRKALDQPAAGPALEDLCAPGCRVACVIPDLTRRASVKQYLPVLLGRLKEAGIDQSHVTIVVALGIHRPLTEPELLDLVGRDILENYSVLNHDPDSKDQNVLLGTTDAGIRVEVNRRVVEADHVILTGGVTYHYFAGYGGGRKSLLPGVASRETCLAHHKLVVDWRRGRLGGKMEAGVLEGNPVHEQMLQACSFLRSVFILNVVTDPAGMIIAASAGELEAAHTQVCRLHDNWFRVELDEPSGLVIASSGGSPKDVNFVQAHKGLYSAHRAVRGNGAVILAARCGEGTGHPDMLGWFEACQTEERWLEELESRYQINGQTAFSTWLRVTSVPTILVSEMDGGIVKKMGMIPAGDMVEALEAANGILGGLPVPLIIPDAADILPVVNRKEG